MKALVAVAAIALDSTAAGSIAEEVAIAADSIVVGAVAMEVEVAPIAAIEIALDSTVVVAVVDSGSIVVGFVAAPIVVLGGIVPGPIEAAVDPIAVRVGIEAAATRGFVGLLLVWRLRRRRPGRGQPGRCGCDARCRGLQV